MNLLTRIWLVPALLGAVLSYAADIEGAVVVMKTMTKRKVTQSANPYERGPAVELSADSKEDPIAYERSHVAIYLEGPGSAHKPVTATLEQKNRRFTPDLLVIPAGSTVSFPNLDPIFHNVFSLSKPKSFDLGNYSMNQTRMVTFLKEGVVFVNCHLHPNMSAVILVTPNQWAVRAEASGKFLLPGVPPGKYTIVAWHKAGGAFRKEVQVTEKGLTGVQFIIPLEESEIGKGMVH